MSWGRCCFGVEANLPTRRAIIGRPQSISCPLVNIGRPCSRACFMACERMSFTPPGLHSVVTSF